MIAADKTSTPPDLTILSLGAGVQSTTMLLMSLYGELPPVDHAIFADTQDEPQEVYAHLERLKAECEKYGLPFHRVTAGSLSDSVFGPKRKGRFMVPFFQRNEDGTRGQGKRQCTVDYKLTPITQKERELCGVGPRQRMKSTVERWIGITVDEIHRMKPSRIAWERNRWPLVEMRMNRNDCHKWLEARGWTAAKSACVYCPFHSNAEWRRLKAIPSEWARVIEIDRKLNERGEFLHQTLKPIDEANIGDDSAQLNLWGNECEGMCGV